RPRSNSSNAGPIKALTEFRSPEGVFTLRGRPFICGIKGGKSPAPTSSRSKNSTNNCPSKLSVVVPRPKKILPVSEDDDQDGEGSTGSVLSTHPPVVLAFNYKEHLRTYPYPLEDDDDEEGGIQVSSLLY